MLIVFVLDELLIEWSFMSQLIAFGNKGVDEGFTTLLRKEADAIPDPKIDIHSGRNRCTETGGPCTRWK